MKSGSGRRVLVVEDDVDIRMTMVEVLEDEGYEVFVAADGTQALRVLQEQSSAPDLILLDIMMPNMNGFEFREEQLKSVTHRSIPVAIISADGNVREKAEMLRAAGFAQKPLKVQPLLDLVEGILGRGSP